MGQNNSSSANNTGDISETSKDTHITSNDGDTHHHSEHSTHRHDKHSHSHSHGHHHHHSRYRSKHSSKNAKNGKLSKALSRHKNVIINIVSCTISVILLVLLATRIDRYITVATNKSSTADITQSTVKIETSIYPDKISLVSDAISYYLNPENSGSTAIEVYKAFKGFEGGLDCGRPVTFIYRTVGLPVGVSVESAKLVILESDTNQLARSYYFESAAETVEIFNLKTGARYNYRLYLTLTNSGTVETAGGFETEASPRILNVDGLFNARDIGGWTTVDGKTIRQGLLFRGREMDGAVEPTYLLTDKGKEQLISDLGVRFDMDLRPASDNKSGIDALGNDVIHRYYGAPMYSNAFDDHGREVIKNIFSDLANPENYPIYLHCTYGRDRTGTICYLLEALLGLSDADLRKEYEISLFTDSYVNYAEFDTFTARIRSMDGATTKEKVENWLLSIGVTAEEIASIREIFLGE